MPDQDKIKSTANVLEAMVAEVSTSKPQRGARLSPVGAEKLIASIPAAEPRPNPIAGLLVAFPYDDPQTMVQALVVALDEVDHVRKGIIYLLAALGGEPGPTEEPDPNAAIKAAEKQADVMAELRKNGVVGRPILPAGADAARVADSIVDGGEDPGQAAEFAANFKAQQEAAQAATFKQAGWTCPDHDGFVDTKSPKGREFRRCAQYPACKQFEK